MERVFYKDLAPERRGGEKSISPVTTNLSTVVYKVRFGTGREGADMDEDFGREFVDGRERVPQRSEGTGGFDQAFFCDDDLRRRENTVESSVGS